MSFVSFVPGPSANAGPSTPARLSTNHQPSRVVREYRNQEAIPNELDPLPGFGLSSDLDESEKEIVLEEAEESDAEVLNNQ